MSNEPLDALTQHLDRMELENRWWRGGTTALLVLVTALFLMGQLPSRKPPHVIEAEQFVVKDTSGRIRVIVGAQDSALRYGSTARFSREEYGLHVYGNDRKGRALLTDRLDGGNLALADKEGRVRADWRVRGDGDTTLMLVTEKGTSPVRLGTNERRFYFTLESHVPHDRRALRLELGAPGTVPASLLVLRDTDGKVIWSAT